MEIKVIELVFIRKIKECLNLREVWYTFRTVFLFASKIKMLN